MSLSAAEKTVITPAGGVPPVGPYSPGIFAGDYLYVSGQGAAKPDGSFPADHGGADRPDAHERAPHCRGAPDSRWSTSSTRTSTSRTSRGVDDMNRAWRKAFPKNPPARAVLGVEKMPVDTPVEITVVAVRDLNTKRSIQPSALESRGVLTADRLYVSSCPTLDAMADVLKAAGLDLRHMAFVNPYVTAKLRIGEMNQDYAKHFEFGNTPARATIQVAALPGGAAVAFTGVAARDLAQRRAVRPKNMPPSATASPCVFIGDTLFCSAKSGFIPGPNSGIYASTVETQLRQTMRNLLDGLEEAGMTLRRRGRDERVPGRYRRVHAHEQGVRRVLRQSPADPHHASRPSRRWSARPMRTTAGRRWSRSR